MKTSFMFNGIKVETDYVKVVCQVMDEIKDNADFSCVALYTTVKTMVTLTGSREKAAKLLKKYYPCAAMFGIRTIVVDKDILKCLTKRERIAVLLHEWTHITKNTTEEALCDKTAIDAGYEAELRSGISKLLWYMSGGSTIKHEFIVMENICSAAYSHRNNWMVNEFTFKVSEKISNKLTQLSELIISKI